MPFKSEKQRKWMHANEPEMAKDWEKKNESPQYRKTNKVDCPKCDGGGCDHCGGKGYHINEGPQKDRNELALHMIELNKMLANAKILQKRKDPKAKIYIKMIQQDLKDAKKKLAKIKNESHHDRNEGKMAKYDVKEIAQDAADVFKMIDEEDDLPEWLEAKITKAADYMNSVKDYLTHHMGKEKD